MLLQLSDEILDMIFDMVFTFHRTHAVNFAATCRALRRYVPQQTPGYFPLSMQARTEYPRIFLLQDSDQELFRSCLLPCFSRTHFTPFMRLSEVVEVARRIQFQKPSKVQRLGWTVPTLSITKFLTKIICNGHKVHGSRPFGCPQVTQLLYNYDQTDFRQNVLDAADLAACYLTLVCPRKVSLNELLLACLHCVRNTNVNLLRKLHCDPHLQSHVRENLEKIPEDVDGLLIPRVSSLARSLLN